MKIKNIPKDSPFDFTEYVEKQKGENEIDIGLFFEIAEQNRNIYNQTPLNSIIERIKKIEMAFILMVILAYVTTERSIRIDFLKIAMN